MLKDRIERAPDSSGASLLMKKLRESNLERRTVAQIVHDYLRTELAEADEENWSAAGELQDLYDCHVCVNHVAQVYVKGIMGALQVGEFLTNSEPAGEISAGNACRATSGKIVFGMRELVPEEELRLIVRRTLEPKMRLPLLCGEKKGGYEVLGREEALVRLEELRECGERPVLVDVRPEAEFHAGSLPGAVNLPLAKLLKNPYRAAPDLHTGIFLFCEEGYQSEMAAHCLSDAGFEKVYAFAASLGE